MAGKLSDLTEITTVASGDMFEVLDVSDTTDSTSGSNKKIQKSNLVTGLVLTDISDVTASVTEVNYTDGVTSAIQTQIDTKQAIVSGVSDTEIGYLNGVTSAIQTQMNLKAPLASPTFTTPTLGVATATTINKVTITAPATASTLTIAQGSSLITAGAYAITLTATNTTGVTLPTTGTLSTLAGSETFTNKRITKRVSTVTSSATPTPNADTDDIYTVTALAEGATFGAPTGTPTSGQPLIIRIKDNASARALAFNAIYRFSTDLIAPTTTVLSKTIYLGFMYNSADSKWDCLAKLDNF